MAQDAITVTGIERYQEALAKMQTDNPRTRKELQRIIRKAIGEARRNVSQDAGRVLDNDPRHAYKAVRNSVYRSILGGQVNILPSKKRGAATRHQYQRKLDKNPHQRGGNRRPRSMETMRYESYEGKDRNFILRFVNAGTAERETRYGKRGSITARQWFGASSTNRINQASEVIVGEIEKMLQQEFQLM